MPRVAVKVHDTGPSTAVNVRRSALASQQRLVAQEADCASDVPGGAAGNGIRHCLLKPREGVCNPADDLLALCSPDDLRRLDALCSRGLDGLVFGKDPADSRLRGKRLEIRM